MNIWLLFALSYIPGFFAARELNRREAVKEQRDQYDRLVREAWDKYKQERRAWSDHNSWLIYSKVPKDKRYYKPFEGKYEEPEMPPLEPDLCTFLCILAVSPITTTAWAVYFALSALYRLFTWIGDRFNKIQSKTPKAIICARPPKKKRQEIRRKEYERVVARNLQLEKELEIVREEDHAV